MNEVTLQVIDTLAAVVTAIAAIVAAIAAFGIKGGTKKIDESIQKITHGRENWRNLRDQRLRKKEVALGLNKMIDDNSARFMMCDDLLAFAEDIFETYSWEDAEEESPGDGVEKYIRSRLEEEEKRDISNATLGANTVELSERSDKTITMEVRRVIDKCGLVVGYRFECKESE